MFIKVTYPTYGDRSEFLGEELVGYFKDESEAKKELRNLCPWDFNDMWGTSSYQDFRFEQLPGTLTDSDKKFISESQGRLAAARKHAKRKSWHERAPKDWK